MLEEERMQFEFMQARLIESESRMHHYETLVRNRDQELTKTKRVSTLTCIGNNVSRSLSVCVHICANLLQSGRRHVLNCLAWLCPLQVSCYRLQFHLMSGYVVEITSGLMCGALTVMSFSN